MQIDIKEIVNVEGSAFVSTTGFTYIVVVFLLIFYLALVPTASFVDSLFIVNPGEQSFDNGSETSLSKLPVFAY